MDELIYQFLLQAGYPRAAIIADTSLLVAEQEEATIGSTTFAIVDPETARRLAVIDVVEAIDADELRAVADRAGRYAERLGGREVQGFVIRVDPQGYGDAERVQFYRVWPNPRIRQLTAKTFPDLDGLRVAHLLALESAASDRPSRRLDVGNGGGTSERTVDEGADKAAEPAHGGAAGRYVPAIVLTLLAIADWYLEQTRGAGLLSLAQALLAIGAASLLTLVAVARPAS